MRARYGHVHVRPGGRRRERRVGWGGDLRLQAAKAYENLVVALRAAGSSPADLVKITTLVVGWRPAYLAVIHEVRRSVLGLEAAPVSSLIGVDSLVDPRLLIEVEGIAVRA